MTSVEGRPIVSEVEQFALYRADLRHQFRRDCVGYALAVFALVVMSFISPMALIGIAIWTMILIVEAISTFGKSETTSSNRFIRWKRRQIWLAAGSGDTRSLKQLQNVQ